MIILHLEGINLLDLGWEEKIYSQAQAQNYNQNFTSILGMRKGQGPTLAPSILSVTETTRVCFLQIRPCVSCKPALRVCAH